MNRINKTVKAFIGLSFLLCISAPTEAAPQKAKPEKRTKPSLVLSGEGSEFFPEGEGILYTKVLAAYQKNDLVAVYKERDLLLKYYPNSIHADNALYLAGLLDLQKGRMAEALKNFSRIVAEYPLGNKVPAALFAKGVTYKKLNLSTTAQKVLKDLIRKYPRSQERRRAEMELQLLKDQG